MQDRSGSEYIRKGLKALLQIGEFSKVCQGSVKTLHHYDRIVLLVPAGADRLTGCRYDEYNSFENGSDELIIKKI